MLIWGQVKSMVKKIHALWGTVTTLEFILIILRSQQRHLSIRIIQLTYPIRRSLWLLSREQVFGMQELKRRIECYNSSSQDGGLIEDVDGKGKIESVMSLSVFVLFLKQSQ